MGTSFVHRRRSFWLHLFVCLTVIAANGLALFGAPTLTSASLADNENAIDELGQQDANTTGSFASIFTKGTGNSTVQRNVFDYSNGNAYAQMMKTVVDSVHHRLFVADTNNNRILIYNLSAGNALTTRDPAFVLGQTDFNANNPHGGSAFVITQSGLYVPTGLAYDSVHDRLFVSDPADARVLVFDTSSITNGMNAVHVLGQTDFVSNNVVVDQSGMQYPEGLAYDATNDRLFVSDAGIGRIMVFDTSSITDGQNATHEIGEPDFFTSSNFFASPTRSTLNTPRGLAYDDAGSRLIVADNSFNRVLFFDVSPGTIADSENASNVLGQPDFVTNNFATGQSTLSSPNDVAYDAGNNRLFVAGSSDSRVMEFDTSLLTDNENASHVLGQTDFTTSTGGLSQSHFRLTYGVTYEPSTNTLYVADQGNNRTMLFDVTSITDGQNAVDELGQVDADVTSSTSPLYNKNSANSTPSRVSMSGPRGSAVDTVHHRLFTSDEFNSRIMVYGLDSSDNFIHNYPDFVLGQTDFNGSNGAGTQSGLNDPIDLAYDGVHNRLFAVDFSNSRVLEYDTTSITNGQNAAHVLGEPDFVTTGGGTTQSTMFNPIGVAYDGIHDRLFVGDTGNQRVLVFDTSSIVDGQNATHVLGQTDFVSNGTGTTQSTFTNPSGLAYDGGGDRLFVADANNGRVLVFDTSSITDGQNATHVLGQADFVTSGGSTTQSTLSAPEDLAFDAASNRLFVADTGNNRVVVFDVTSITDGQNAINVLGQADYVSNGSQLTRSGFNQPQGLSYSSTNNVLYVGDNGNNRVLYFDGAANSSPSLTFNIGVQPAATACDGTFAGSGGTVALGTITPSIVASSDAASVQHICTRLTTNGGSGAIVTVMSLNAALKSTGTPADTVPSATATLVAGTAGYGVCAGSAGSDSGKDSGASPAASSPFNGTCTSSAHSVGALTTSMQNIWTISGPATNAFFRIYVKAAVSSTTPAHADYGDTLTFIATATY